MRSGKGSFFSQINQSERSLKTWSANAKRQGFILQSNQPIRTVLENMVSQCKAARVHSSVQSTNRNDSRKHGQPMRSGKGPSILQSNQPIRTVLENLVSQYEAARVHSSVQSTKQNGSRKPGQPMRSGKGPSILQSNQPIRTVLVNLVSH